jgi:hypothetical protein
METLNGTHNDAARDRLAAELADVEASIALVASDVASNITLTGLRFGRQVADNLRPAAAARGVNLEPAFSPDDDTACDLRITRTSEAANG